MSDDVTEKNYREDVQALAREVLERVRDEGADESDALHEAVDGSCWVIYTYRARHVLMFSRNEDAAFDTMGAEFLSGAETMGEIYTRAAFWAMHQDVTDALHELRDEIPEEEEAES
jgi:hypothetical protein